MLQYTPNKWLNVSQEEVCAQLISYYHLHIYDLQLSVSPGEKDAAFTVCPLTIEVIWALVTAVTNVKCSCQNLMGFMWGVADTSDTFSFQVVFPFKLLDLQRALSIAHDAINVLMHSSGGLR